MSGANRSRRSYGTGSLYVRADGTGRERGTASGRHGGGGIKRSIGPKREGSRDGLTRTQAEAKLRRLIARRPSRDPTGERLTLAEVGPPLPRQPQRQGPQAVDARGRGACLASGSCRHFGDRALDAIRGEDVEDLMAEMEGGDAGPAGGRATKARAAPKTIRNYIGTLSAIYRFAMHPRRRWATANPCDDVDLPDVEGNEDIRFLEPVEVDALADARGRGRLPGDRPGVLPHRRDDRAAARRADRAALARRRLERDARPRPPELRARRVRHAEVAALDAQRADGRRGRPASSTASSRRRRRRDDDDLVFADPHHGRAAEQGREQLAATARRSRPRGSTSRTASTICATRSGRGWPRRASPMRTLQEWMGHRDIATTQRYADYAPSTHEAELIAAALGGMRPDPWGHSWGQYERIAAHLSKRRPLWNAERSRLSAPPGWSSSPVSPTFSADRAALTLTPAPKRAGRRRSERAEDLVGVVPRLDLQHAVVVGAVVRAGRVLELRVGEVRVRARSVRVHQCPDRASQSRAARPAPARRLDHDRVLEQEALRTVDEGGGVRRARGCTPRPRAWKSSSRDWPGTRSPPGGRQAPRSCGWERAPEEIGPAEERAVLRVVGRGRLGQVAPRLAVVGIVRDRGRRRARPRTRDQLRPAARRLRPRSRASLRTRHRGRRAGSPRARSPARWRRSRPGSSAPSPARPPSPRRGGGAARRRWKLVAVGDASVLSSRLVTTPNPPRPRRAAPRTGRRRPGRRTRRCARPPAPPAPEGGRTSARACDRGSRARRRARARRSPRPGRSRRRSSGRAHPARRRPPQASRPRRSSRCRGRRDTSLIGVTSITIARSTSAPRSSGRRS